MAYQVIVADDQRLTRQALEACIEKSADFVLAGAFPSASLAVEFCRRKTADLALLDIVMPGGMNGLEAARQIRELRPDMKIVLATSMPEVSFLKRAREIGVNSFWYKETDEVPLLALLSRTMAGESVYPDRTPVVAVGEVSSAELTPAELAVLRELTTGATNREISEKLHISVMTVNSHVQNMLQKTGYKNRVQLALKARLEGIVIAES